MDENLLKPAAPPGPVPPGAEAGGDAPPTRPRALRRLLAWGARAGIERRAALVLAVCSIISGFATYFILTRTPPVGPDPREVAALLTLNLVLLLVFGAVVARQLVEVWVQRRRGLAGSRLHTRLVMLFSAVAVTPTIVVAIFSYVLLSIGMESLVQREGAHRAVRVARRGRGLS